MSSPAIILFDGHCVLCNRWVDFIIHRDPRKKFRFGALQTDAAKQLLSINGLGISMLDSIVLIDKGQVYLKSTAALRILRQLHSPLRYGYVLIFIPKFIRDPFYSLMARFRYRIFGRNQECRIISSGSEDLFI